MVFSLELNCGGGAESINCNVRIAVPNPLMYTNPKGKIS